MSLPAGFVWGVFFFRAGALDATSRAGGVVVAVHRSIVGAADVVEVSRGRRMALRLRHGEAEIDMVRNIRECADMGDARPVMRKVDWNFLAADDCRIALERGT